jgi:hypothetical protein
VQLAVENDHLLLLLRSCCSSSSDSRYVDDLSLLASCSHLLLSNI